MSFAGDEWVAQMTEVVVGVKVDVAVAGEVGVNVCVGVLVGMRVKVAEGSGVTVHFCSLNIPQRTVWVEEEDGEKKFPNKLATNRPPPIMAPVFKRLFDLFDF